MERLTFDGDFCDIAMCLETRGGPYCKDAPCSQRQVWERLKAYEDMEARGELIALPCKVGDMVWGLRTTGRGQIVRDGEVKEIYFTEDMRMGIKIIGVCVGEWGKTVFATREEAEAALATDTNVGHMEGMA